MITLITRPLIPLVLAGSLFLVNSLGHYLVKPEDKAFKTTEAPKGWTEVDTSTDSNYTKEELEEMPTISQSQFDDLKIDTGSTRVWLSRMTVEDGMPYNNQVTIEKLKNGRWETVREYQAR